MLVATGFMVCGMKLPLHLGGGNFMPTVMAPAPEKWFPQAPRKWCPQPLSFAPWDDNCVTLESTAAHLQ